MSFLSRRGRIYVSFLSCRCLDKALSCSSPESRGPLGWWIEVQAGPCAGDGVKHLMWRLLHGELPQNKTPQVTPRSRDLHTRSPTRDTRSNPSRTETHTRARTKGNWELCQGMRVPVPADTERVCLSLGGDRGGKREWGGGVVAGLSHHTSSAPKRPSALTTRPPSHDMRHVDLPALVLLEAQAFWHA